MARVQGNRTTTGAVEIEKVQHPAMERGMTSGSFDGDRTRWGPIWGGLITTVSTFLLMEMFVVWVGWLTISAGSGGIASTGRAWITWIVTVIAFFLGGLVAALVSPVRGMFARGIDGFLVWGLGVALMIAGSLVGGGLIFGSIGSTIMRITMLTPSHTGTAANLSGIAGDAQTAAFWAFITLITTAAAAVIGSWLGNTRDPVGYYDRRDNVA